MARQNPNIIITGTPGVGKTTHAEQLARATGFKHVSVNQIVKDEGFHEGKDEETGSWIVDEDKVRLDLLSHFRLMERWRTCKIREPAIITVLPGLQLALVLGLPSHWTLCSRELPSIANTY